MSSEESTTDYPPSAHEHSPPLELPTSTTTPARVPAPAATVEGLTCAEAATAYGVSVSTVRRLLKAGKIPGAAKVPTVKGIEYRIPPASLESLGYSVKATQSGAILTAARAAREAEELAQKLKQVEASLALETFRREAAEKELKAVSLNLDDLRGALARIPLQLEAPKRRGLFKRK